MYHLVLIHGCNSKKSVDAFLRGSPCWYISQEQKTDTKIELRARSLHDGDEELLFGKRVDVSVKLPAMTL